MLLMILFQIHIIKTDIQGVKKIQRAINKNINLMQGLNGLALEK